jgi:hypothetical protein
MLRRRDSHWSARLTLALAVTAASGVGGGYSATSAQTASLPSGRGADLVQSKCLASHESDLIRQQRLAPAGWERELEKMIRWGTPVTATERGVLLDYLATNFDRRQSCRPAAAAAARIPDVFRTTCLTCHGSDLEQQRLGRAGWIREVDKMIRWGASVADTEKDPLVDYLAGRFAP